jgi:hypothetical protein
MPFRICPECQHEREGNDEYGWCACDNPECPDYRGPALVNEDELVVVMAARRHLIRMILEATLFSSEERVAELTKELATYNASISLAKELVKK